MVSIPKIKRHREPPDAVTKGAKQPTRLKAIFIITHRHERGKPMDACDYEDYRRDAEFDATHKTYKVVVVLKVPIEVTAANEEEAENLACDEIESVMEPAYKDYNFVSFESEEVQY